MWLVGPDPKGPSHAHCWVPKSIPWNTPLRNPGDSPGGGLSKSTVVVWPLATRVQASAKKRLAVTRGLEKRIISSLLFRLPDIDEVDVRVVRDGRCQSEVAVEDEVTAVPAQRGPGREPVVAEQPAPMVGEATHLGAVELHQSQLVVVHAPSLL